MSVVVPLWPLPLVRWGMSRSSYEPWGDGESVALVSSRLPADRFGSECSDVFERRYARLVVRVVRADLMRSVAGRLRPQGLRTFCAVDPSLSVCRWLVWSVALPVAEPVAGAGFSVGRVCSQCRGVFMVCGDGQVLTRCPCGDCMPF